MSDMAVARPRPAFAIGRYEFARTRNGRWECSDLKRGRGVGGCRTPLGAYLALRRWQKEPATPE